MPRKTTALNVANRLAAARLAANYRSQSDFATALGVSRGLVGQWETGIKLPGRANLAKIAKITAVPMEYLLGQSNQPKQALTTSDPFEIRIVLLSRQMSERQKQRFAEFLTIGPEITSSIKQEPEPTNS